MNHIIKKIHTFLFVLPFIFSLAMVFSGLMASSSEVFYCEERPFRFLFFTSHVFFLISIFLYLFFSLFDGVFREKRKFFLIAIVVVYLFLGLPVFSIAQKYFNNYEKEWTYFLSQYDKEKFEKKIENLSKKINEAPTLYSYKKRAYLYFKMKDYKKAIKDASKALDFDKNDLDSLRIIGIANFFLGNDKIALQAYENFLITASKKNYLNSKRGSTVTKEIALMYSYLLDLPKKNEFDTVINPNYATYEGGFENSRPLEDGKTLCKKKHADYFISRNFKTGSWYINVNCNRESNKLKGIKPKFYFHNKQNLKKNHKERAKEVLEII